MITGREWDGGKENPEIFNPANVDADQLRPELGRNDRPGQPSQADSHVVEAAQVVERVLPSWVYQVSLSPLARRDLQRIVGDISRLHSRPLPPANNRLVNPK